MEYTIIVLCVIMICIGFFIGYMICYVRIISIKDDMKRECIYFVAWYNLCPRKDVIGKDYEQLYDECQKFKNKKVEI